MHNGRSKDGRLLYPAFPYQHFTLITRADSDAIFSYLRSVPAVERSNTPHAVRFPYNLQASLAIWRALYFKPAAFELQTQASQQWNRGAYLVRGLGHCGACHAQRNFLGATSNDIELGGGLIPMQNWYAPSLADPQEAGMQSWHESEIVALMNDGVSTHGSVLGPMAEVVYRSTQHVHEEDLAAIAAYLKSLPVMRTKVLAVPASADEEMKIGANIYADRCSSCHGRNGEGYEGMYPRLAKNRAVTLAVPNNVIKAILNGGFPPTTTGNPRPFGMPGFAHALKDQEIAAVSTYIRQSWGNSAPAVSAREVLRNR
jgi:mono/diheme cytochrome c family protein